MTPDLRWLVVLKASGQAAALAVVAGLLLWVNRAR
jgi:Na+(H+)/acetate symporter ActP